MSAKNKRNAIINATIALLLFLPLMIMYKSPIFIIGTAVLVFFSMVGFYSLHEHPTTVIRGYSSIRLLLGGALGIFFFGISAFIVIDNLRLYNIDAVNYKSFPILLILSLIFTSFCLVICHNMYDAYGFTTCVTPAIAFYFAGCMFLFLFKSYILIILGLFFTVGGGMVAACVFASLLNVYTPEYNPRRFYLIRHLIMVTSCSLGLLISHFCTTRFAFLIAALICVIIMAVVPITTVFIRISNFDLYTEDGEEKLPEILKAFAHPESEPVTWTEYPRPQLKRKEWLNLNGVWKLNHDTVYVPFPPQSALSGYRKPVMDYLTYERTFRVPNEWDQKTLLLHFGAVDQICEVFVNDQPVGNHVGGYLPFSFDVTKYVRYNMENKLTVKVTDTLNKTYPYGKQKRNRGGMWYTPVSGIWQTVWMEPVPKTYIERIKITADTRKVDFKIITANRPDIIHRVHATIMLDNGEEYFFETDESRFTVDLSKIKLKDGTAYKPRLWCPEDPYLYNMKITFAGDEVETYFGLRTIQSDFVNDIPRVLLNGHPVWLHGVLDQGYYPDGIFTPSSAAEYERDLQRIKDLGFNFVRKHIKIEPEVFYYYCDKMGLLVMQDMVNSGVYRYIRDTIIPSLANKNSSDNARLGTKKRKEFFIRHCHDTLRALHNHPSIIAYTIFNEGWGQFQADKLYDMLKMKDSTRLYDATSGWFIQSRSDFDSHHQYYTSAIFPVTVRPMMISECGGFTYRIPDHYFSMYNQFSYGVSSSTEELTANIKKMYEDMLFPVLKKGGCGCVYTQLTDVEDETNGLFTYDRKVCKVDREVMLEIRAEIDRLMSEI